MVILESRHQINYREFNIILKLFIYVIGTAPCNGDSGSPLVLMVNGRNYIRGIVSAGHKNHNDNTVCDPNYPVLFTDVAIFRDWIETNTA